MRAFISLTLIMGFLTGCSLFPPDNPAEELVEEVIKDVTGVGIDLSDDDEKIGN